MSVFACVVPPFPDHLAAVGRCRWSGRARGRAHDWAAAALRLLTAALVTAVCARTATLRGVHRTVRVSVPETVDMSKIKVGGEVRAVITEAMVLAVEPAPTAPAKPTTKPAPKG